MNKRMKSSSTFVERNNQEALHLRNKSSIGALNELMKDVALVRHRKTLDEVAKAMTRSLESDQKWYTKCQELQAALSAKQEELQTAIQVSEEDKNAISRLKTELQNAWNIIEELNLRSCKESMKECAEKGDMIPKENGQRVTATHKVAEETSEDRYKLLDEIEKGKLQVFELEEELTNKEKSIEELMTKLSFKSKQLEDIANENAKLKVKLDKATISSNKDSSVKAVPNKEIQSDVYVDQMYEGQISLKKKLEDASKKEKITLEKVKHFVKKNKLLNRQLQLIKKQNNLMKLQLAEQTRMLDLLTSQCCKLEEKDKKQTFAITALKSIRDKYAHVIGSLEQKIHEMKKKYC